MKEKFYVKSNWNDQGERERLIRLVDELRLTAPIDDIAWLKHVEYAVINSDVTLNLSIRSKTGLLKMAGFDVYPASYIDKMKEGREDVCSGCGRHSPGTIEEEDVWTSFAEARDHVNNPFMSLNYPRENEKYDCWAILNYDDRTTSYRWKVDRPEWADNLVCQGCVLAAIASGDLVPLDACGWCGESHGPVTCKICDWKTECITGEKQGVNCASHSFYKEDRWWVGCGYGSDFDMDLYWVTSEPGKLAGAGTGVNPICDKCLTGFMEYSFLKKMPEDFAFQRNPEDPEPILIPMTPEVWNDFIDGLRKDMGDDVP